ncbi:MAG: lysophospholipid acyltransferase family protein, partial [Opitutaceae bacterium]
LTSASKDGEVLAETCRHFTMEAARGSSSRRGAQALRECLTYIKKGRDVCITPDGPRGPCYEFKPGAIIVARRTRAPMLLVGAEFTSSWRLKSWDRFHLPKPFSRVRMRCEIIEPEQLADRDAGTELVHSRLLALNPDR